MPKFEYMTEADIAINGTELSFGQSMALRVAATSFMEQMGEPGALGDDAHGKTMATNYRARLKEVLELMVGDRSK